MKRSQKKSETLEVRLPHHTKQAFMAWCQRRGLTASEVVRRFIEKRLKTDRFPFAYKLGSLPIMPFFKKPLYQAGAVTVMIGVGIVASLSPATADPRIEVVFRWLDVDGDSRLSPEEFLSPRQDTNPPDTGLEITVGTHKRPANESREELFARLDLDASGGISLEELVSQTYAETKLSKVILDADQDRSDSIDEAELAAFITQRRANGGAAEPSAGAALMAKGLVAAHDQDGDGMLSESELPLTQQ